MRESSHCDDDDQDGSDDDTEMKQLQLKSLKEMSKSGHSRQEYSHCWSSCSEGGDEGHSWLKNLRSRSWFLRKILRSKETLMSQSEIQTEKKDDDGDDLQGLLR